MVKKIMCSALVVSMIHGKAGWKTGNVLCMMNR